MTEESRPLRWWEILDEGSSKELPFADLFETEVGTASPQPEEEPA